MKTGTFVAGLAIAFAGSAQAALTPINPNGNGDGSERCLAGTACRSGAYAGAFSILRAFEIDQGLPSGSLQRVDDAFDRRWRAVGPAPAIRPLARYADDDSVLGVSAAAGITTLTGVLADQRVGVDHPALFASGPSAADFMRNPYPWYRIPTQPAPFAFVLRNRSSSLFLSSDTSLPGFSNSGYTQDWMVTWRVPGQNVYLVAWEDRMEIGSNGLPNDYDYNDDVSVIRDVEPVSPVPLPSTLAIFLAGLCTLGVGIRRAKGAAAFGGRAAVTIRR